MKNKDFPYFDIYPVISSELCGGRSIFYVLNQVIEGGAKIVQLREKNLSDRQLLKTAIKFREITLQAGVLLVIDDRVDIALICGADGVHLGQEDLPVLEARKLIKKYLHNKKFIIGLSTHNKIEALQGVKLADYINIGPVFKTNSKKLSMKPIGIEMVKWAYKNIKIPFTVMGGIKKQNIPMLKEAGANRIALITEITLSKNISRTTAELIKLLNHSF